MSYKNKDSWLEAAKENFEEAVSQGNLPLAKDIIADVLEVSPSAGRAMSEQLREVPVSQFTKSPYQNI